MGNRVKGRAKKKSIKAALSSSAGSKRKLSRMGKKQKKEHAGLQATFVGRSKCLKLLQVTLKDFRRLCILKGIYPREPRNGRVPGNKKGQSFYHVKDIRAIAHEPLLDKFREFRAFLKKVRRAAGRNERNEAARRNALLPSYTLHHLVKERYPRFVDALSDLDDALTLTYLFAALPGQGDVKSSVTNKAKKLAAAWGAYCATTSSITKSFVSVKGVYLEATVRGGDATEIRWIVPHSFTQYLPQDVDYRIVQTFFEFYETLLNFVLYKLYSDIGVRYPVNLDAVVGTGGGSSVVAGSTSAILAANLRALTDALQSSDGAIGNVVSAMMVEGEGAKQEEPKRKKANKSSAKDRIESASAVALKTLDDESDDDDDDDDEEDDEDVDVAGPLHAALQNMAEEEARTIRPGSGAGGSAADGKTAAAIELDDESVKRRRLFQGLTFFLSREVPRGYLELVCLAYGARVGWEGDDSSPITITDPTISHHIVDRPRLPATYDSLPKSREYVQPQWILDSANFLFLLPVTKYGVGATLPPHLSPWVDDEEEGYKPAYAEEIERLKNGEVVDDDSVMEAEDVSEDAATSKPADMDEEDLAENSGSDEEKNEKEEEQEEDDDEAIRKRREKQRKKEEAEAHALAKTMMNRKAAHLYGRMQHGLAQKQAKVDTLHQRRKEIDSGKEKSASGKSALKQKVERLKKERQVIEDTYANVPKTRSSKRNNQKRRSG